MSPRPGSTPKGNLKKTLVVLLAALLLIVVATLISVAGVEEHAWNSMKADLRARQGDARIPAYLRPSLRGAAVPGNAWDDYVLAVFEVRQYPSWQQLHFLSPNSAAVQDRALLLQALEQRPKILIHLRQGTHRTSVQFPEARFPHPAGGECLADYALRDAAWVAYAHALGLAQSGELPAAAEEFLDLAVVGCDLGASASGSRYYGEVEVLEAALEGLRGVIVQARLDPAEWSRVLEALTRLDNLVPREGPAILKEVVDFWTGALDWDQGRGIPVGFGADKVGPARAWRYCFSGRLVVTSAYAEFKPCMESLTRAASFSDAEITAAKDEIRRLSRSWPHPAFHPLGIVTASVVDDLRTARAHVRLLIMAASIRVRGEAASLEDPFGGRLHSRKQGTRWYLWSAGTDGADNLGVGDWSTRRSGTDLVLVLEE